MNISTLEAKVKAAQKANAKKIATAVKEATLKAQLALATSKDLFDANVKLATISSNTARLQALVDECSGIIDGTPVHNTKTRSVREWSGSRRFAFGSQINLMFQLATGIMYSCAEHKQLLLAHTKVDVELLEQFVEAFGSPAYYSRNNNKFVESKDYDVEAAISATTLMQSQLGVIVDTTLLTATVFDDEFAKAEVTAKEDTEKAEEAINEADMAI